MYIRITFWCQFFLGRFSSLCFYCWKGLTLDFISFCLFFCVRLKHKDKGNVSQILGNEHLTLGLFLTQTIWRINSNTEFSFSNKRTFKLTLEFISKVGVGSRGWGFGFLWRKRIGFFALRPLFFFSNSAWNNTPVSVISYLCIFSHYQI